jgi:hypothetical protein
MWVIIRFPRQTGIGILGLVTHVIVLGLVSFQGIYECWLTFASRYLIQYRKLGVEQASVSGQEFYPIYILAPQSLLFLLPSTICCSDTYRIACSYCWLLFCIFLDAIPRSCERSQRTAKRSRYFPLPSCELLFFYKGNNRLEAAGDRFRATFQFFESATYSNSASPLY